MSEYIDRTLVDRRVYEIREKWPGITEGTAQLVAKHELKNREVLPDETYTRLLQIEKRFDELDYECIRPSRALISGYGTAADREKMKAINRESMTLRDEFRRLTGASA